MDLSRIQLVPLVLGVIAWVVALAFVWLRPEPDLLRLREQDFAEWKHLRGKPEATFAEFLGSEQAPHFYLSRASASIVISALALLALWSALRSWSVIP